MNRFFKKECFISHCSADVQIMQFLSELIKKHYGNYEIFNTFDVNCATKAGEDRADAIRTNLKRSSAMIAVITDSYLRSTICISEVSAFWYTEKPVIPIVFNGKIGSRFLFDLFGKDIIYIDTQLESTKCAKNFLSAMQKAGFPLSATDNNALRDFRSFFNNCQQAKSDRNFIGMGADFRNILSYCDKFGVHQFKNSIMSTDDLISKLSDKDEIMILSTTGANLINTLSSEFLPSAIRNGVDLTLLLPNKYSEYTTDVARIEMPGSPEYNVNRLSNEFNNVMINLCNVVKKAHCLGSEKIGHIYVGCSFTLLRQTIIIGKKKDYVWGWASLTLPPKKTNDGTPSLEFSGSIKNKSMAKIMYEHLLAIKEIAQKKQSSWIEILPDTNASTLSFGNERISAKREWQELYNNAKLNTEYHNQYYSDVLIEVAAQHPLMKDGTPGNEFMKRLDCAMELYHKLVSDGNNVRIYVPGSLHQYNGHADSLSLSAAGIAYLISKGINKEHLLGEEKNNYYKGDKGVYNSADECFVASKIFFDDRYKQVYCICSPNQLLRKQLFYMAFGVVPMMITVPCNELMHDPIYEIFESIPQVIMHDHTWQDDNSEQGRRTRKERNPNLT